MKRIVAMTLILTLTAPVGLAEASQPSRKGFSEYKGILPDAYYRGLAKCETGGNWKHSTLNYTGGLGIARGTAHRWSGHRNLAKMTPREQVKVADRIAFRGWTNKRGEHVWRVGPWGWGCLKQSKYLQGFICRSQHPLVQRWKRNCGQ